MIGVTQFPWNQWESARCEVCGGIVSWSYTKGDTSDPKNAATDSPCAKYWHTECAAEELRNSERDRAWLEACIQMRKDCE